MSPFILFRLSVVVPFILTVAAVIYAFWAEASFSQEWKDIFAWNGDGGMIPYSMDDASIATWIFVLTLSLTAIVAMLNQILFFFCWKPSRMIFLITNILMYPAILLLGLSVLAPVEYMLYQLSAFISGISLALAFYSPVAQRFSSSPNANP